MLASASDYHTFHKFTPGGRNQAAQTYLDAVQMALRRGHPPPAAPGGRHPRADGFHAAVRRGGA